MWLRFLFLHASLNEIVLFELNQGWSHLIRTWGELIVIAKSITAALTEPDHGSDVAGGLETIAEKKSDKWVINGSKKWIGGANVADVIPIFAVNKETGKPVCFVVRPEQDGVDIDVLQDKIALRIVPNALITLKDVEVSEEDRLQNINSFKDIAKILYSTRAGVPIWQQAVWLEHYVPH